MDIKYALVSGRIIAYQPDSVVYEEPFNESSIPMVRYTDVHGIRCATGVENFILGDLDELQAMLDEREYILTEQVKKALRMPKFSTATPTEKIIIEYMIYDELDPNRISYGDVKEIARYCIRNMRHCNSLREAYLYYMHEDD